MINDNLMITCEYDMVNASANSFDNKVTCK